jgi:putative membrane protein
LTGDARALTEAKESGVALRAAARWRRVALALAVAAFAVLWAGGVASAWLGAENDNQGRLASLFLLLAGVIVLLGARGRRSVLALASLALFGFAVEAVGVRFGIPFGSYAYTGALQPQLLGVPLVICLAWMALVAYACDVAVRLPLPAWATVIIAALWTTAIDLIIDPLAANKLAYWRWDKTGIYYGIPASNFGGWFITALAASGVFGRWLKGNFWASLVGAAIVVFFSLNALANALFPVALTGLLLCAAQLTLALLTRKRNAK